MKDKIKKLRWNPAYDVSGIRRKMEKMAKKGWMLDGATKMYWKFHRIRSQNLHFAVTWYDDEWTGVSRKQEEYWDYCASTGWKLVLNEKPLQIFCNEQENPQPLETEPLVQAENIYQAMKKELFMRILLVLLTIFCGIAVLMIALNWQLVVTDPGDVMYWFVAALCWAGGIAAVLFIRLSHFLWFKSAKKLALTTGKLKRTGVHYPLITAIVIVLVVLEVIGSVTAPQNQHTVTYTGAGVPLTVSDLGQNVTDKGYEYIIDKNQLIGIRHIEIDQYHDGDEAIDQKRDSEASSNNAAGEEMPTMEVKIYLVQRPAFYQTALHMAWGQFDLDRKVQKTLPDYLKKTDAGAWGADAVYQFVPRKNGQWESGYVLCYKDRIVALDLYNFSRPIDTKTQQAVAEKIRTIQ